MVEPPGDEVGGHGDMLHAVLGGIHADDIVQPRGNAVVQRLQIHDTGDAVGAAQFITEHTALEVVGYELPGLVQGRGGHPQDSRMVGVPPAETGHEGCQRRRGTEAPDPVALALPPDRVGMVPVGIDGEAPAPRIGVKLIPRIADSAASPAPWGGSYPARPRDTA